MRKEQHRFYTVLLDFSKGKKSCQKAQGILVIYLISTNMTYVVIYFSIYIYCMTNSYFDLAYLILRRKV